MDITVARLASGNLPEGEKESLIFRIVIDKTNTLMSDLYMFMKICRRHGLNPEIDFINDICEDTLTAQVHVRDFIDKTNVIAKEWNEYAEKKYHLSSN